MHISHGVILLFKEKKKNKQDNFTSSMFSFRSIASFLAHFLSGIVMLAYLLPIDGSDHSVSFRNKNCVISVRRWVGIQADLSKNPDVITIGLLTRIFPSFHMFQYQVVLGLRKPLLMLPLKSISWPGVSLLDWSLPSTPFIPPQEACRQVYFFCYLISHSL